MKKGLLVLFLFSVLVLASTSTSAANCGGNISCNCGDTVVEDYVLDRDLFCESTYWPPTSIGLMVGSEGINIDCNGHSITSDNNEPNFNIANYAIHTLNKDNITIKNCHFHYFFCGIYANSKNNFIHNNEFNDSALGIWTTGPNNTIRNNEMHHNYRAIWINGNGNLISNNNIYNNYQGISFYSISPPGPFTNNTFWINRFVNNDIVVDEDNTIGNHWNNSNVGNFWDDFDDNIGYPDYYLVPGNAGSVDYHPIWFCKEGIEPEVCSEQTPFCCRYGELVADCQQCGCPSDRPKCQENGHCTKADKPTLPFIIAN
ncbi:MAG: NosD domain-containing protein [Candidatus Woesearchaeota archaeon]